jgi:hypothetical protein
MEGGMARKRRGTARGRRVAAARESAEYRVSAQRTPIPQERSSRADCTHRIPELESHSAQYSAGEHTDIEGQCARGLLKTRGEAEAG